MIKIFLRNASPEIENALFLKILPMITDSAGYIESTRCCKRYDFEKGELFCK